MQMIPIMIVIFGKDGAFEWDGSSGEFGHGVHKRLREVAPEAKVIGIIAPIGFPLLQSWQSCVNDGASPIILHYPTAKLSRVYWEDEIQKAVKSVGIDAILCADSGCIPTVDIPVVDLSTVVPVALPDGYIERGLSGDGKIIQMSSGTTGHRKGIIFTIDAIRSHVLDYNRTLGLTESDCVVSWLPLYHDMGFIAAFLMPRILGCRLVLLDPIEWVRQPDLLWETIERYHGTVCYMPNFGFEILANRGRHMPTMRKWISCSEPTRRQTMERFIQATGAEPSQVGNCWGMAENIFAVAQSDGIKSHIIDGVEVVSCGKPIFGTEVRVVDGELYVKSAYSISEYLGMGSIIDQDGFYPSGDHGTIIDGEIFLQGRRRDILNHAGRKMLLSDLDFKAAEEIPESSGRIASFGQFDQGLGTDVPIILLESPLFWAQNRDAETISRVVRRTGIEASRAYFVPPRFITKTSSGKVNRKKTKEHWEALQAFRDEVRATDPGPAVARTEAEVREIFPALDFDMPVGEQVDSLGLVNLALVFAKHGLRSDIDAAFTVRGALDRQVTASDATEVIKIVSLCDRHPFVGKLSPIFNNLLHRYDKPVHIKHICAPPAPILLSDMIFADYFLPRDSRREAYAPLLSTLNDIRSANVVIVDDLVHYAWLLAQQVYPRINHDFRPSPLAPFMALRWARYSEGHHQIPCDVIDGAELEPELVNQHLDRLQSYLNVPFVRIAYGNTAPHLTGDWDVQGLGDAVGVATLGQGLKIDDRTFQEQFLAAVDRAVQAAPPRWGEAEPILDITDQPHWCSWIINKNLLDFVLDRFDNLLVLGKPASVPYLQMEAERRGKRIMYRSDLQVTDDCDCVLQTGSSQKPQTDKPIFQIMGAGWPGEPAVNLPEEVLKECPSNRVWSRHNVTFL